MYGRLEEPDGLQGLMKMRQGGPRPEDQRLAAEKAGDWSEALTIYEQAMQYQSRSSGGGGSSSGGGSGSAAAAALLECGLGAEAEGLSPTQRGYLGCLLNMGHLQGLLAQVEGMAAAGGSGQGAAAVAQLAAMGTAAAWRLGRWGLLEGYTQVAQGGYGALDPDARWEVRLGRLLGAVVPGDGDALHRELDAARSEVMGPFSAAAMESYDRAYPHLVKLHMLQEISDAGHALAGPAQRRGQMNWEERLALTQPSLATQEPILALRRQLTSLCGAGAEVGQCWLQYAQLCRATGHHEAATTAVLEAGACQVPTAGLEQVLLLWDKGQPYRAVAQLQQLDRALSDAAPRCAAAGRAGGAAGEHSRYHAQVVLQLAQWMAETGQGTRDEIVGERVGCTTAPGGKGSGPEGGPGKWLGDWVTRSAGGSPWQVGVANALVPHVHPLEKSDTGHQAFRLDARGHRTVVVLGGSTPTLTRPTCPRPPQSCLSARPAWRGAGRRGSSATRSIWMR